MSKYQNYIKAGKLLDTLLDLAEKGLIDNKEERDPVTGKLVNKSQVSKKNAGMIAINQAFPDFSDNFENGKNCQSLSSCLLQIVAHYTYDDKMLGGIFRKLKQLGPYLHARESQLLTNAKKAFNHPKYTAKRTDAFRKAVDEYTRRTAAEKQIEEKKNPQIRAKLAERLENPIEMDMTTLLDTVRSTYDRTSKIKSNMDPQSINELGAVLQTALATRSIDIMRDTVMNVSLDPDDEQNVIITGQSKQKPGAVKESWSVRPVGLKPAEVIQGVALYRKQLNPIVRELEKKFAGKLKPYKKTPDVYNQKVNDLVGASRNVQLNTTIQALFPAQQAQAKARGNDNFTSHNLRSLGVNASYELYGKPAGKSMDLYLTTALKHHGTGSMVNYKNVKIIPSEDVKEQEPPVAAPIIAPPILAPPILAPPILAASIPVAPILAPPIIAPPILAAGGDDDDIVPPVMPVERKRKRPNVPPHRIYREFTEGIYDRKGTPVQFTRFQKKEDNTRLTEDEFKERVAEAEELLEEANCWVKQANIKAFNIGSRAVNCYWSGRKIETYCDATDYSAEPKRRRVYVDEEEEE